jgi:hypothetical protein
MARKRTDNKSLYDDDYRYTEDANKLDIQCGDALQPIIRQWCNKGYSPREILGLVITTVHTICLEEML